MLKIDNLTVQIKNKVLLNDISFRIKSGELLVIIGPNGAGKSTLLRAIAQELPYSGSILFQNQPITNWDSQNLAKNRAKFSQHNPQDIPLPVQEVVMMGRYPYFSNNASNTDLKIVVESLQLTEMNRFKNQPYNRLSGGEKQRIHLSRIFAQLHNSNSDKLMLLDEPLNNLDIYYQHKTLNAIQNFVKQGNVGIIVMHDLNLAAQFADYILLLKKGTIVKSGKPDEVLTPNIICNTYEFPCQVMPHPIAKTPLIIFGEKQQTPTL
ncbi:heme ABC transporter ATP-binding protein [Zunongwangia sp.]|uniref:heme ABC transporter ATP-binding protein n=1 Tax=Zunongwangia sp. TaxID=1965325 RepID=UPI003AA84790